MSGMLGWHCARAAQNILRSHFRLRWEETAESSWLGLFCLAAEACTAGTAYLSSCRAARWSLWYQAVLGLHLWWKGIRGATGRGFAMVAHELVPLQLDIPGLNCLSVLARAVPET